MLLLPHNIHLSEALFQAAMRHANFIFALFASNEVCFV
jgi:hypothetical protein